MVEKILAPPFSSRGILLLKFFRIIGENIEISGTMIEIGDSLVIRLD